MTADAKVVLSTLRELIRHQLGLLTEREQVSVAISLREDALEFLERDPALTREVFHDKSAAHKARAKAVAH